jgi:NADH dehydrogenase
MKITIVGGGFGGIKAALELAEEKNNHITLVTDRLDFQYYPALYSSATGHSHLESWVPLGTIFAGKHNIQVHIDTVVSIDPAKKTLQGKSGKIYDYEQCILALGTVTTYFGIKGLETYAYGIKSEAEIKRLKQHIYTDIAERHVMDKRYVIVGAGPTGVELAAALGSYLRSMCEHYSLKKLNIKIDLIEAAPRILPRMHEKSSKKVQKRLEKLGVNVQVGKTVESASEDDLIVSGKSIDSHTVIWTSGVANHPFYKANEEHFEFSKNGRIVVDDYMRVDKNLYVIGDNAATPFTGLAQTALHDALFVADNLKRQAKGKRLKKYKAVMPPVVVPVGENWAVFEWHGLRIHGWIASLLRRAADFIGYNDMLPLGQALGVWRATMVMEDDYFTPTDLENSPRNK